MKLRLLAILTATSTAVPTGAAAGQLPGAIRGQVTDSLGLPVSLATVLLLGTTHSATTDSMGLFRFAALPPKPYSVLVRAIGWKPLIFELIVGQGEEWIGRIGLEPAPVMLPEVRVTGRPTKPAKYASTSRFDDFYRRRALGFGHFLTRDQIDAAVAAGAGRVGSLVERMNIPGVRSGAGLSFERCKGGGAKVGVWIDGAKVPNAGTRRMPDLESLINVRDIEAIEVYRGVAQIPGEFLDDSCAAVAIWTKYN